MLDAGLREGASGVKGTQDRLEGGESRFTIVLFRIWTG